MSGTIAASLGVFLALYVALGAADFVLMRRYARPAGGPPPEPKDEPVAAVSF